MKLSALIIAAAFSLFATAAIAELPAKGLKEQLEMAKSFEPSFVQVEYQLQQDKGEMPQSGMFGERCPNCGQIHANGMQEFISEERPLITAGFILSPTQILTEDIQTHPRFIKSIQVRKGSQLLAANVVSYARDQTAVILQLAEPLKEAKPLKFDSARSGPYQTVNYKFLNGEWQVLIGSVSTKVTVPATTPAFLSLPSFSLITDAAATPVAFSMNEELPVDNSWKVSPLTWKWISADEMKGSLSTLEQAAAASIVRVDLSFRSPKSADKTAAYRGREDRDDNETEKNVLGLVLSEDRVLILADLKPKLTARLQRIQVVTGDGKSIEAKFLGSLKDEGALVAKLNSPVSSAVKFSSESILQFRNRLLSSAEISVQGEKRVAYLMPSRIAAFKVRWRQRIYPQIASGSDKCFLFDGENRLVAFPIVHRDKSAAERYSPDTPDLTASVNLQSVLANPAQSFDGANVPLSEEEENRIAWMGVELQAMNKELARVNNVSEETHNGEVGAMVTHVYPNSPAAEAGIKPGAILLRLRTADKPSPLEVRVEDDERFQQAFPWDRLDEVQEQYFDRIPAPWPVVENTFTRMLTDLGIGTEYTAEFFENGKGVEKKMKVVASPAHYNSATRYKADALGVTVRNLTYEVRRYLQLGDDAPGVIISKIESGSKTSTSGIKPFEMVTHINEKPVQNVKDFEKLIAESGELNFSIKRMAKGRLVKIRSGDATK
jgi:serine protease Do